MCHSVIGRKYLLPCGLLLTFAAASIFITRGAAADKKTDKGPVQGDAAIRATATAFIKAFDARNATAIANLWTANGSLIDDEGHIFKGRKAIEEQYAALFKEHPSARMQIGISSIEFPTPATAVEDGVAQVVTNDNAPPAASRYTALHVREDGKWLMASVRESTIAVPSIYVRLEALSWIIGAWERKADGETAHSRFRWIANKSFIQRDYSVHRGGLVTSSGTQIIGFDPRAEQVRSWSFDSSGGYGTALWTQAPEGMRLDSTGVTADGVPTSSKEILIRVAGEDNVLGWRSFDRKIGEMKLPDTREVVLDRVPEKR
jgi:uncharacterized protein (TIGR02246 family)